MSKEYKLTQEGADMVGRHAGESLTPREDKFGVCAEGEHCFSIDAEGPFNPDDIQCYVALESYMFEVTDSIQ